MNALFFTALTMGMIGSFHCVGMCGPLALSLPLGNNNISRFAGSLLYNIGRITTYTVLGLLLGVAGKSFSMFGLQQTLSLTIGIIILIILVLSRRQKGIVRTSSLMDRYSAGLRNKIGYLYKKQNHGSLFAIGALNGLLPCGFVYIAVAGALATADAFSSAVFMAAFGAGTLPVMWSFSFFGNYISLAVRKKIKSAYPVLVAVMACGLIIRGLGLDIPYISPALNPQTQQVLECHPLVQH